jgi:hypothetical protein
MSRSHDPRDPHEPLPTVERTAPSSADPDAVPALMRPLDRLLAVRSPTLAPLVRWSASDAGAVLVHAVPVGAIPLDTLRREGPLRAGHVLTVALAVTDALVALHAAGLAHGSVGPMSVLVAPDGSVVLAGTGLGWRAAPGMLGGPTPEADVAATGDLVRLLIGRGGAPGALVLAALRASDSDPLLRPEAAGLAGVLRACGRPESLLDALWHQPGAALPPSESEPERGGAPRSATGAPPRPGAPRPDSRDADVAAEPSTPGSRARGRREAASARRRPVVGLRTIATVALVVLVGLGAVRAVTAVGARAAEAGPTTPPAATVETSSASAEPQPTDADTATTTTPSSTDALTLDPGTGAQQAIDWAGVLAALDSGRRTALASGSRDDLARWVDPAGVAWGRDAALLQRMAGSDARIEGGELVLEEVKPLRAEAGRVLLAVRDRRAAYDVAVDGTTTHVPERAAAWWTVTLTPLPALDGEGWRIAEVRGREDRAG